MKAQNYYEILGVSKVASDDQIQRAYRKLARKYHPDVSKDKDADKKFKELSEAREVLKDPEKRKLYDTYGANWQQEKDRPRSQHRYDGQAAPGSGGYSQSFHFTGNDFGESADFDEILENLFRQGAGDQSGYGRHNYDSPGKPTDAEITVTLSEVFHGAGRTLTLQSYELGSDSKMQPVARALQVKIPKGITDGAVIRLAGHGERDGGRGMGLPKRNGSARDTIVELDLQIPDHITGEEERLFMEMAKIFKFNPPAKKTQRAGSQANG